MKKRIRKLFKLPFLERFLVWLNANKEYGSLLTRLTPNHTDYSSGTLRKVTRSNIKYVLDISNIVDWFIYFNFKELSQQRLIDLVSPTDIVFDVGGNIGSVALPMALKANEGKVYSFEPFPTTFDRLREHVQLNNLPNLSIFNIGLGNQNGELLFQSNFQGNPGMNRVTDDKSLADSTILTTKIDEFCAQHHIDKIDLIKIDVEGYEFEVLKGAENVLNQCKPKLFIELDDENLKLQHSSAVELINWLLEKKYSIVNAESNQKIDSSFDFAKCHFDIICS